MAHLTFSQALCYSNITISRSCYHCITSPRLTQLHFDESRLGQSTSCCLATASTKHTEELAQGGDKDWELEWQKFLEGFTSSAEVPKLLRSMCGVFAEERFQKEDQQEGAEEGNGERVEESEVAKQLRKLRSAPEEAQAGFLHSCIYIYKRLCVVLVYFDFVQFSEPGTPKHFQRIEQVLSYSQS